MANKLKRVCALVFLVLFGGYHLACVIQYREFSEGWRPSEIVGVNWFWFARWKMFTGLSTYHTVPEFQARSFDETVQLMGEWEPIPMEEWFPARWESGYRWERPSAYNRPNVQVKFLELACERSGADFVRLVLHKWKATLGQREQPVRKYRQKDLGVLDCTQKSKPAQGVRL